MLQHDQTIQCYSHRMNWNRYRKLRFTWRKVGLTLESSRVQSDTRRHGIDYFVYLLWPSAGMRTYRQSRVESSRVEYSRVQSDSQRRGRDYLAYVLRPRASTYRHSPFESSPVHSDSPKRGICLTYNGCAQECVHIGRGKSNATSLAELTVLELHVSFSSVGLQGSGATDAILHSEMDVEKWFF